MKKNNSFSTWREFTQEEFKRFGTFQLSIDELAKDVYYDDTKEEKEETEELNFDY